MTSGYIFVLGSYFVLPPLGEEPPGGLWQQEGDGEDEGELGEDHPVEGGPVTQPAGQPGLVHCSTVQYSTVQYSTVQYSTGLVPGTPH